MIGKGNLRNENKGMNVTFQESVQDAILAHGEWKHRLMKAIAMGEADISVENCAKDTVCFFGSWLYGEEIPQEAKIPEYEQVCQLHRDFHKVASEVLRFALEGDKDAACDLLEGGFMVQSKALIKSLLVWERRVLEHLVA